jgi:hypothetical protein
MYSVPRSTPRTAEIAKTFVVKRKIVAKSVMSGETRDAMMVVLVGCAQLRTPIHREYVFFINEERCLLRKESKKTISSMGRKIKSPEKLFSLYI